MVDETGLQLKLYKEQTESIVFKDSAAPAFSVEYAPNKLLVAESQNMYLVHDW